MKKKYYTKHEAKRYVLSFLTRLFTSVKRVSKVMERKHGIKYPYTGRICDTEIAFEGNSGSVSGVFYMEWYRLPNHTISVFCSSGWGGKRKDQMRIGLHFHKYDGNFMPTERFTIYPSRGKADRDRAVRKIEKSLIKHCLTLEKANPCDFDRVNLPESRMAV